ELIDARVRVPAEDDDDPDTVFRSPLNSSGEGLREFLPLLMDRCTTQRAAELPARINVNTAPATVLYALPGLSEGDVQTILNLRPPPGSADLADPVFQTPAWLITEANISPQVVRTLERYVTARSQVYRVQVFGYFNRPGPVARLEAVIDTNQGNPRVVYWRDLTELGKDGFDLRVQ
ncbi:MAG TPA: type II secretion system protein GspK, partial [Gemmataceae bacterium]